MARPSKARDDQAVGDRVMGEQVMGEQVTGDQGVGEQVVGEPGVGEPARDDQAARVWTVMRDLAAHYPPPDLLRGALNLGRGTGRVKALLQLAGGPLSVSGLAEAVSVDAPYATLIVDTLEERGLVERRSDPDDRRRKLVELTPAGQEAIGRVERILREPPEGFADLSPRELDVLEDLVTRITARSAPSS
jgi:DNA-binding MarR family transcriptional regulator